MEKVVIADLAVEGGGFTIYGQEIEGRWFFWEEGSSFGLDENDDEEIRSWKSEPKESLESVLPNQWPLFHPWHLHAEFVTWFVERFPLALESLSVPDRLKNRAQHLWQVYLKAPL